MRNDLPILAIYLGVDQLTDTDLVVVQEVTRCILEVPLHLPGEATSKATVELVYKLSPGRYSGSIHRNRLTGAPKCQLCRRVVGAGLPERTPPCFQASVLPFQVSPPGSFGAGIE